MTRFDFDRWALVLLAGAALVLTGRAWLRVHPQYDPAAPLLLGDPPGWATARKLAALRDDPAVCRGFLARNAIAFTTLPPTGEGQCRRADRIIVHPDRALGLVLRPGSAQVTCGIGAGLARWLVTGVQPQARAILGSRVVALDHYGSFSCRRIVGGDSGGGGGRGGGGWSQHATGNAIDIAGFVLADGRTITVARDWRGGGARARFLHAARDAACGPFATVLSPDYNAAHADHLHLDQAAGLPGWSFCR